ncbi:glycoside hydrolase family 16 protein [Asticcacaulis solisilvae]|uniref:glycoside hydrolase family 16 protein n=1 Tax=Asticcacaulis solisilvae TaxID=1217274 RepID=UPI003FD88445
MRTAALALLSALCLLGAHGAAAQTAQPSQWHLVFADEFDGTTLDATHWTPAQDCWGGGNQERQCYTRRPENVAVHDGMLELTARLEEVTGPALPADQRDPAKEIARATKPFSSGKIMTRGAFSFTYGRVDVRARLPQGQGVWPAIWMLPETDTYGPWPKSGELDILEAVNLGAKCSSCVGPVENDLYGTLHYDQPWEQSQAIARLPAAALGDWHTYSVEWSADRITWLLDDKPYGSAKLANWAHAKPSGPGLPPFDKPFYLILDLAVGGLWPESHDEGGVTLGGFPKSMQVDWVHVYSCDGDATARACVK